GGEFFEGALTIASTTASATNGLDASGYNVFYGNSYIQSVTWENGAVHAEGFITYSQSTDPASPHFDDYTREYSAKRWNRLPFTDAAIEADRIDVVHLTE
ncbi:MAG: penicillin acylase family protein, partial [Sinimarinibacterium sp.]